MAAIPEIGVEEVKRLLDEGAPMRLLDVREEWEWLAARIEGAELLTEEVARELLERGDREARLVFSCHHGVRSLGAAQFFARQGFANVASMAGGIDEWSLRIDPGVPRY